MKSKPKQEIVFDKPKENHVYAEYDDNKRLVLIKEPIKGKKYFEFAMVAGGDNDQTNR